MLWSKHNVVARPVFLLIVLLGMISVLPAESADRIARPRLFAEGNALYQKGDFAAAQTVYESLVATGVESGTLFYNLGNACFKQKKLGDAIYYWEKALRLLPGDHEIRENLELANLMVVDRIEVPPDPLPIRIFVRIVHILNPGLEASLALFLFATCNLFLGFFFIARSPRVALTTLIGSILSGALFVCLAASAGWKIYEQSYRVQGVVIEEKIEIRSGPGAENITVVTVHEGSKVSVRTEAAGWYQVSLSNGWTGWLPKSSIRLL